MADVLFPCSILEAAARRGLRLLVIGGHAVAHHHYPRTTEDVDFLVSREDRDAWLNLAALEGLELLHDGGNFLQFNAPDVTGWRLDLMLVSQETFSSMAADAGTGTLSGQTVAMPSLEHLLALKLHALKHSRGIRVLKDMDDVVNLIVNNRIDPKSETFRALMAKHGNETIHEQILRACPA